MINLLVELGQIMHVEHVRVKVGIHVRNCRFRLFFSVFCCFCDKSVRGYDYRGCIMISMLLRSKNLQAKDNRKVLMSPIVKECAFSLQFCLVSFLDQRYLLLSPLDNPTILLARSNTRLHTRNRPSREL